MTRWTDERIPLWVPPVEDEALDSWIEAYARRLAVSGGEFTRFLGLSGTDPRFMVRRLTDAECDTLARRTGLTPEALAAMTLDRFDGVTVAIDPDKRTIGRPPAWRHYGSRSRFCPACLADNHGRWPLAWRLPWSFACVRHELLLCDYCLACGHHPPVSTRGRGRPSSPGVCLHATETGRAIRCGYPLIESPAPALRPDGAVLAAQLAVSREILDASVAEEARTRGQELYVLARRALRGIRELPSAPSVVTAVLDDCGGALPALAVRDEASDAHNTAVGTAVAVIATDPGHPACDEVFAWLMSTDRPRVPRSNYATSKISEWLPAGPRVVNRMLSAADSELTFIARLRYGTATPAPCWPDRGDEDVRHRASKLPAMIWPSWAFRLLPVKTDAPVAGFRRACSSLILLPGTNWDYLQTASLLSNTSPKSNRRTLDAAVALAGAETLVMVLPALAKALDSHPVPIDYDRRRRLFSPDSVAFDHNAYQALCQRHGWRSHAPIRIQRLRWQLARLLLGAEPGAASRTPTGHLTFHYRLHPDLHELLHEQAAANLESHGIDEPVSWEPPPTWVTDLSLPPGPETINRNQLAQHAANGPEPAELARLLDLDDAHLLLAVETLGTTAPQPVQQRPPTPGRRLPRRGVLAPRSLKRLYQEQQLLQRQIAELAGCSINTVRHALDEAGIPTRRRRPAGYLKKTISRAWLEKEYHHKGRSSPDIARELGVRKDDVMRLVSKWGIPRHPTGHFTNSFASLDTDVSPAMHAVSRTKNCIQRLRHLTVASRHRTLQDAAAELGMTWSTLNYQLKRIEETAGFTIIDFGRSRPLTITEDGHRFLDEAARLLSLLGGHSP
ncbi:TniQ family protein [Streptomyces sp. NPDC088246]|uniref:TniQ family protein n=1 Tax=Streptomyces sp. NPDC088246 TaxID=3365842 RepID=UPI00381AC8A9